MKYRYKTKPRGFQRRALKKAVDRGRLGLWMPMRSGKSKVAVDWASVLHLKYGVRRVLVLTHTVTTFGVWRNEFRKHCPLPYAIGVQKQPTTFPTSTCMEVMILNIQRVFEREYLDRKEWMPVENPMLYEWEPEVIIIDESTCLGDPASVQTSLLYRLVSQLGIRFILELTGTPAHRQIWGVFGQFRVLDESVFGSSLKSYKLEFGVWGGYGGKTFIKHRNMKRWRRKVEPHVFQMRRIPYRKPVEQVIPVELSPKSWGLYDDMERKALAYVNGKGIMAPIVLTQILKCCQIAAGVVRDEDGRWHRVGTELRDAFEDTVRSLSESEVNRIVVFARHLPELRDAAIACKQAGYRTLLLHGGVDPSSRERRIARFHDPGGKIAFISQISTGSMGIDLSAADTALYYTLTESLLHKDQADARIRKHGDKRALTYYYFLPRGTHLETMFKALKSKMDMVEYIAHHPDLIHHEELG